MFFSNEAEANEWLPFDEPDDLLDHVAYAYPDHFEEWRQYRELSRKDDVNTAKQIKEAEAEEAIRRQSLACESAEPAHKVKR